MEPAVVNKNMAPVTKTVAPKGNPVFEDNVNLALRVAFFVCLLSAPLCFSLPSGTGTGGYWRYALDNHYLSAISLQYVFYTVQKSTGATLRQILNCFVGLCIAGTVITALNYVHPGGVKADADWASWTALAVGVTYMIIVPFLNFPLVTVVFACSRFSILWMQFTRPNVPFSKNLAMELGGIIFGGSAAVLANLLPRPRLACNNSVAICQKLSGTIQVCWRDFNEYYLGEERLTLEISRLNANLSSIYGQLQALEAQLQDSYWENVFSAQRRKANVMMNRQHEVVFRAYGRLLDLLHLCANEDFGDSHDFVVQRIRATVNSLTGLACTLLAKCAEFSCDGDINDEEAGELEQLIDAVKREEVRFTQIYHDCKLQAIRRFDPELQLRGVTQADSQISKTLMDEDAYCFEVCGFVRLVYTDAQDLLDERQGLIKLAVPKAPAASLLNAFDPKALQDPDQQEFALKTSMAIILGFLVGYCSSGVLLTQYDFRVPYLVGLLTKKGGGSAIYRSLARMQGMIIGFVTASIARVLLFHELDHFIGSPMVIQGTMLVLLFGLVTGAMFLYFHGAAGNAAFVGQLIAVVGAPQLAIRYDGESTYNYRASQTLTNAIIVTLIIMGLVNNSFGIRVSTQAPKKLKALWTKMGETLQELTDPSKASTTEAKGGIRALMAAARGLNAEADQEPRYSRSPWRTVLFANVCDSIERIRLAARTIQIVGSQDRVAGGARTEFFMGVVRLDSFQTLARMLTEKHAECFELMQIFEHEQGEKLEVAKSREFETQQFKATWEQEMARFLAEVNQPQHLTMHSRKSRSSLSLDVSQGPQQLPTLDWDVACQMSRIALNLESILDEIFKLQVGIIENSR